MYLHRAVWGSHSFKAWDTFAQFDQDAPLDLGTLAMFPRLYEDDGELVCVFKAHDGGIATRLTSTGVRTVIGEGDTVGNSPVIFDAEGRIYVQRTDSGKVWRYTFEGAYLDQVDAPYASEGLHHVDSVTGRVVMGNDVSLNGRIGPAEFWGMTIDEATGIIAGQCDGGDTIDGSIGLAYPDGRLEMAQIGNIAIPVQLSVVGLVPWVAATGAHTPEPDALPREPYRKYQPPVPALPPSVIGPQRPSWIVDTEGILTPRGNGISTSDGPGPRYYEDALWTSPSMEPTLEAIYWGPEPPRNGVSRSMAYATCRDLAKRNGVPVTVCDEWGASPTAEWIAAFTADGVNAVWMVEAYRPAGEPLEAYRSRMAARFILAGSVYAVVAPYYEQSGGGSEASSIETLNALREELAARPTPPIMIDLFGLRRPPSSSARQSDAAAWIAATAQPQSLRVPLAPPAQKPPVVIVVPPPQPKPPRLTFWQKLLLLLKGRTRR